MPTERQKRAVARKGRSSMEDATRPDPERTYKKGPRKQYPWDLRVGFTPEQEEWLDMVANEQDCSMNDVVRAAVDRMREAGSWPKIPRSR